MVGDNGVMLAKNIINPLLHKIIFEIFAEYFVIYWLLEGYGWYFFVISLLNDKMLVVLQQIIPNV